MAALCTKASFDLETGAFLRESTHQGWRHDSSWARGLSWAIYGFSTAYSFTQDPRFCRPPALRRLLHPEYAGAWHLPQRLAGAESARPFEASAAAITASGLQDLAALVGDPLRARQLSRVCQCRIMNSLSEPAFLACDDDEWEGLLKQAAYHERLGLGVDESTMFGDYFFLESAAKLLKLI